MATSPSPLVWDFYRVVPGAEGLGSCIEYFTEDAQSIYLNHGLMTRTEKIQDGDWEGAEFSDEIRLVSGSPEKSTWDHPSNGQLFGGGIAGNTVFI